MKLLPVLLILFLCGCHAGRQIKLPKRSSTLGGTAFYQQAAAMNWQQRDSFAVQQALAGNIPSFLRNFLPIQLYYTDSVTGKTVHATCYVAPDYFSIGTDDDWARVPITPMAAQEIADSLHCFLSTRRLADLVYAQATVKLEPVPMYAFRDSTPTMWQHHLIIEGQRKGRKGLIAGIKKDVVISGRLQTESRPDRVAIYGWHRSDGRPIQQLYTGHVNWYVDYSHGIRLIYRRIRVNGTWMDYTDLLKDPLLRRLICDEERCDFYRYQATASDYCTIIRINS